MAAQYDDHRSDCKGPKCGEGARSCGGTLVGTEAARTLARVSSTPPKTDPPFRFAASFHKAEDSGSVTPGHFEAQYEQLFAEVLSDGPISPEDRERLDMAAATMGIDQERLRRLESALVAAYQARESFANVDSNGPDSLAEREPARPRQESIPELTDDDDAETPPARPVVLKSGFPLPFAPERLPGDELRARIAEGTLDDQFRAVSVLVLRGVATEHERALHEAHRPRSPLRPTRPLGAHDWNAHLLHPDEDRLAGEIFGVIASAALLGRITALRRDRALPRLDPAQKQDPTTSTVSATRAVAWAAATMGLKAPAIFLAPDLDAGMDCIAALPPALRIGARMLRGQSAIQLAFHSARVLAWFRSDHFVCTLVPDVVHLEDLFLAALRIGAPHLPMPHAVRARVDVIRDAILPVLEPAAVTTLSYHVSAFIDRGGRTSLRAWARAAELTACRAGLLLSGDLLSACALVGREPNGEERVSDLATFWASDACGALRRQLGVALG
jgi:hypothetical protein